MDQPAGQPVPPPQPPDVRIDALLPAEIAERAEEIGARKTRVDAVALLTLAVLAGAFIAFGALFSTTVLASAEGAIPLGAARALAGVAFALGLVLVVVGGAELFTGNTLMVMAWASGRVRLVEMLRAWALVYLGNLVGALGTAFLVLLAGQYLLGNGSVGAVALDIGAAKAGLPFLRALFLGVLANVLVCLAVWLAMGGHSTTDKVVAIILPIAAFVAAGAEHSVANMYQIPLALLIKAFAPAAFWSAIGAAPDSYPALTWGGFLANLVPVTIGNVIGGGILVGAVYWFVYLRKRG